MNDLILKFTGDVSKNTFPEYKKEAMAFVNKADFPIVTNEDFSDSVKDVKKCKEIEAAITAAKENSFADMEQINKIFDDLGEVFSTVRTFRLKREKDIVKETERKKTKMVADGFAIVSKSFVAALESTPLIRDVMSICDDPMRLAIKGRRTEESGKKAVAESVKTELSRIETAIELTVDNERIIKDSGYPDLFQDLKQLIGKPTAEIQLLVDGRVAKHQLAERERKEKADAAAKVEADRKAKEKEAKDLEESQKTAKTKEANALGCLASQQQKGDDRPDQKPELTTSRANVNHSTPPETVITEEHVGDYTISFKVTCTIAKAKEVARGIREKHGNASLTEG